MADAIPLFHHSTNPPFHQSMHLVQLLLPLKDPDGKPIPRSRFRRVREMLTDRFGGLTAYTRAPAEGLWDVGDEVDYDDIVVYEVMVSDLDRAWWRSYRESLEADFEQDELVIRALPMEIV